MISVELKIADCDDHSVTLNRLPIKTSKVTEIEVLTGGDRESFLAMCGKVWDQHHGEDR
ncbi:hypothetical protein [Nonomuraea sp. NPDC050643]|uniref:hypothetical protein n=1 Tax=Nonomuraea sp. NPDC050643 TaxID=3155660 RepID=UPI0033ED642A